MRIPVALPNFSARKLVVETAGLFHGPRVLLDEQRVELKSRKGTVRDDSGADVEVELAAQLIDPVPSLKVGGRPYELARPLAWHEHVWLAAPILLFFMGGALGAALGMSAVYANARIFRSDRGTFAKYGLTGMISAAAVVAFLVVAVTVQVLIHGIPEEPAAAATQPPAEKDSAPRSAQP